MHEMNAFEFQHKAIYARIYHMKCAQCKRSHEFAVRILIWIKQSSFF